MRKPVLYLLSIILIISSCKLSRFVVYNFANITDYKIFPSNPIETSEPSFSFSKWDKIKDPGSITIENKKIPFETFLKNEQTVAFLIIQNDSIKYEKYFHGYDQSSIVASFSMAKSVLSMLIGSAIEDGLINSVNDLALDYIPELKDNGFDKLKIEHLLQMTSGIKFNESYYNPFGDAATFYYGNNLLKAIKKLKPEVEPGTRFHYSSGDTQILGLVLNRALKGKSISTYLQEKLCKPMGMEYNASWSVDNRKDKLEKTYCCLNARARDFAKLGRLYLNNGNWNGVQLIPKKWVVESTKIDTTNGSKWYYQYQWWLPSRNGDFTAIGILGQYIYVNPKKNLIIVRLGKKEGNADWKNVFQELVKLY